MTARITERSAGAEISLGAGLGWAIVAIASFHAAQFLGIGWLLIPCAYALIELSRAATNRKVFYPMLGVGFLFYAPQLGFFWNIFNAAAIALWLVLAFWIALFGLILRLVRLRFGNGWMLALAPFIWTGLEYFRCELYYLRFGWLTFGMANTTAPYETAGLGNFLLGFAVVAGAAVIQIWRRTGLPSTSFFLFSTTALTTILSLGHCGGIVTLAVCIASAALAQTPRQLWIRALLFVALFAFAASLALSELNRSRELPRTKQFVQVAGVQLEFPTDDQVLSALNNARAKHPDTQLFLLSEYTFQNPVPQSVRDWCASNQVHLVVGGKEPLGETNFYDMAYVVGTNGHIVFQQGKSVPIQFFKDGLPAPERKTWDSPWGKLGILTCYDLSYTRVVDDFVSQGAIALLNPTMDVKEWGAQEHALHSRVAPMRAAEYGIPIFRVASSGVSQLVSRTGRVLACAPFPGEGEIISGNLPLNATPRLPLDRWLAPACSGIAGLAFAASLIPSRKKYQP